MISHILNIAGREVATIAPRGEFGSGLQSLVWSGRDGSGLAVPNGSYIVQLTARAPDGSSTQQMTPLNLRR